MSQRQLTVDEYFDFKNQEDWLPLNGDGKFDSRNAKGKATADGRWLANADAYLKIPPSLFDPPTDAYELWQRKKAFLEADMVSTMMQFEEVKSQLLRGLDNWRSTLVWRKVYGPRPDDGLEVIQALKTHVEGVSERLEALDRSNPRQAQIDAEAARKARIAAEDAEYRNWHFERQQAIRAVNI